MTHLLPVVDFLAEALTHQARAIWLCTVPLGVIQRDHSDIADVLKQAGFDAGLAYLAALVAHIHTVRLEDGSVPLETRLTTDYARKLMWAAARQGD